MKGFLVKNNIRNNIFSFFEKEDKTQGYIGGLGSEIIQQSFPNYGVGNACWYFLRNYPQAHGITVIAFRPKVFRVSYFSRGTDVQKSLSKSPKIT
jgi:hypothetical protein